MDINELLDEVKAKLNITSDYRLSKELDISEQDLSKYRKGLLMPDVYACFRFAEVLGKAPAVIIAQVQVKKQRNEAKRLYFKRFFSIAGLWIILAGVSALYSPISEAGQTAGKGINTDINGHYAK